MLMLVRRHAADTFALYDDFRYHDTAMPRLIAAHRSRHYQYAVLILCRPFTMKASPLSPSWLNVTIINCCRCTKMMRSLPARTAAIHAMISLLFPVEGAADSAAAAMSFRCRARCRRCGLRHDAFTAADISPRFEAGFEVIFTMPASFLYLALILR